MQEPVLVAKMFISSVQEFHSAEGKQSERLELSAVHGDKGTVNAQWSKWTPSGQLGLTVNNPEAFGRVKPGNYKVQLVPCGEDD